MTNFEFYKDQILEICKKDDYVALFQGKPTFCTNINCYECDFEHGKNDNIHCRANFTKWLYAEHIEKPMLNKYERALCEALQTGWIARDPDGAGKIFYEKPEKTEFRWCAERIPFYLESFETMNTEIKFAFIKWEDSGLWSIEDLLMLEVKK